MLRDPIDAGSGLPDKLPPHNIEAEMGVLGSIVIDPEALAAVVPVLAPDDFYRDAHQAVYRAVVALADAGSRVDTLTLFDELTRSKDIDRVGGYEFIADLVNSVPHSANVGYYASIVRQKAVSRANIEAAQDVLREAYSNEFTAEQLTARSQAKFMAIGDRNLGGTEVSLKEAVVKAFDTMDRRVRREEPGVRLPFGKLDRMLDGFRPSRLYVFAGRPGSGKSALLFNIADHAAMTGYGGSVPILYFSLEMDAEELGERYLSARARVDGYAFKNPDRLSAATHEAICKANDESRRSLLRIDDDGGLTVGMIAARARRHKHKYGLGAVFVDYLQLIEGSRAKNEARQEEVARISRGLKRLAKELRVPVVAAAQINRASENRPAAEQRPRLSDLRESGQIEQDAHGVVLLHADQDAPEVVDVNVAKNRGGATGRLTLRFVRAETRFEEIVPAAAEVADF